ncbi:MAG: hypothetical protein KatS3mg090_0567 [Patescibacteria group bacterium]|nr:MAG: hypothetical protein KatS3mg090_0567 [Patescibacteria group bacterium]
MVTKQLIDKNLDKILQDIRQFQSSIYCIDQDPVLLFEDKKFLTFPGGNNGLFLAIRKTLDNYGFELNKDKFINIYEKIFGKIFAVHTENNRCCFYKLIDKKIKNENEDQNILTPENFTILKKDAKVFKTFSALIINKTDFFIYPQLKDFRQNNFYLLIFNQKRFFEKTKQLSEVLYNQKAVQPLYSDKLDKDFFYQMLATETDLIFWTAISKTFEDLPVFEIREKRFNKALNIEFLGQIKNDKIE